MMRYCVICGDCLNTHNINRVACNKPECKAERKRRQCSQAMRRDRRRAKIRRLVNRHYNPKSEAA